MVKKLYRLAANNQYAWVEYNQNGNDLIKIVDLKQRKDVVGGLPDNTISLMESLYGKSKVINELRGYTKSREGRPTKARIYTFDYEDPGTDRAKRGEKFHGDPRPEVLVTGTRRSHPNTKKSHLFGINLNYLNDEQEDELQSAADEVYAKKGSKARYKIFAKLFPDLTKAYKSYDIKKIDTSDIEADWFEFERVPTPEPEEVPVAPEIEKVPGAEPSVPPQTTEVEPTEEPSTPPEQPQREPRRPSPRPEKAPGAPTTPEQPEGKEGQKETVPIRPEAEAGAPAAQQVPGISNIKPSKTDRKEVKPRTSRQRRQLRPGISDEPDDSGALDHIKGD